MFLHNNTRAERRLCEFFVDAVNLLPIVHGVHEDLASKQIVGKGAEAMHGHRQNNEVSVMGDVSGRDGVGARGKHLHAQFDAISGT
jgi:hypothetical protein